MYGRFASHLWSGWRDKKREGRGGEGRGKVGKGGGEEGERGQETGRWRARERCRTDGSGLFHANGLPGSAKGHF